LRDRQLTPFRGTYAAYARQREERDLRDIDVAEDRAGAIAREKELVQLYRHQRKYSKMHEHEARLEALSPMEKRKSEPKLRLPTEALAGGGPARSYDSVVRAEGLVVGYRKGGEGRGLAAGTPAAADVPIATVPWLELRRGDRVGIVGPNGAGKTTLLRTVAGDLRPLGGVMEIGKNVQLTYLAQLRDAPIPGATVLDALLAEMPLSQSAARSHLARFLFRGDEVLKEVSALSGGERSRLELAMLFLLPSNLLLLDEPTNHLDIPAREALEAFMNSTDATLLIVSHDRRLLEKVCDSLWVVDDGLAVTFDGGYRAWRQAVADGWTVKAAVEQEAKRLHGGRGQDAGGRRPAGAVGTSTLKAGSKTTAAGKASTGSGKAGPTGGSGPEAVPVVSARRARAAKLSKDLYRRRKAAIDEELATLYERKRVLETALTDPAVHGNFVELRRVTSELATVNEALDAAEVVWLEVAESAP
jgi:ATP-binding cassette subfamily F protein 3